MSTVLRQAAPAPAPARAETGAASARLPWHIPAMVFASFSVILGVYWDVSWHRSIGRDTFWSPPHMAIYLGGIVAGLACAVVVLRTTFAGTDADRATSVRFWRWFQGPLGAWVAIWGTFAMLVSAPFDDWWHNAYGLDVEILSPPHTLLALGIWAIQLGALLQVLALQNRVSEAQGQRLYRWIYAVTGGLVLLNVAIMSWENTSRELMHVPMFYQVAGAVYPLFLIGMAWASRLRWRFTAAAGVYMATTMALIWLFPRFPATPKLGPIENPIDYFVAPDFPLLLIVPAVAMDLLARRAEGWNRWKLGAALGATFFLVLLPVQWLFASFLMSPGSRNWFFGTHRTSDYAGIRTYTFVEHATGAGGMAQGLAIGLLLAMVSARIGIAWGDWMRQVRR